jgi:hypothetical protein
MIAIALGIVLAYLIIRCLPGILIACVYLAVPALFIAAVYLGTHLR